LNIAKTPYVAFLFNSLKYKQNNMDNQSLPETAQPFADKIFFIIFGFLLFGSVFFTFYRTIIAKDYIVEAQVDCDPYEKACFVWECDPASTVEGEACTGDPEKDIWYYNLAKRNAANVPLCDPEKDESCAPLLCEPGEKDCEEIYCNQENKLEQEAECNDPLEYTKNNPPEEESDLSAEEIVCEEGDTECEAESAEDVSGEEGECASDDVECQDDASELEVAPASFE
jgi:hypothetical protein